MKLSILDKAEDDLVAGFPFAIFYKVDGETAYVHAVVDCRRRPAWIREHLK